MQKLCVALTVAATALSVAFAAAEEPASIAAQGNAWTLRNDTMQARVSFAEGKLRVESFANRAAHADYLQGQREVPLFTHRINGVTVTADDGSWTLDRTEITDIELYGRRWGKRLEITLSRTKPVAFSTRQLFEIYNGPAALHYASFLKNGTDKEVTVSASDVLALNLPDRPHTLSYVERVFTWRQTAGSLTRGGRNGLVRYDSGDGWFCAPENNWATSLVEGQSNASPDEKFLALDIFAKSGGLRVAVNPNALQLTLFPHEEIAWFGVNLGVFSGDTWDGRMAVAEHLRRRFKFHDPSHILSTNDWQWRGNRTDANYRNIVIPKAAAAGFDRVNIDAEWYTEDGTAPAGHWTDMPALGDLIVARGMKPGHWFPLQGKGGSCVLCWYNGHGRDVADPANIDFKLRQTEEDLIGRYHSAWGQLDCGLLWRTDKTTAYSHPGDSVYRKLLGMRRYIDTITHKYPDYLLHITCEIDNPGGARCAQNTGLAHMGDNTIIGTFNRAETGDDVRDLFASFGQFPLEGELSTPGEGGTSQLSWADSPLWYYQFLLARHTSIYSWPGNWTDESIAHLRVFNDWRKNPRIKAVLDQPLRPVYNGKSWLKNEGPWAWMFTDPHRTKALVIAINHLNLANENAFAAKLRWLDAGKTYLIADITQTPDGEFAYAYRGEFSGAQLQAEGLPIDLEAGAERCAACWIEEQKASAPQVLYADAAVTSYRETSSAGGLAVEVEGRPNAAGRLIVFKAGKNGVEERLIKLDAAGRATAAFDATTITQSAQKSVSAPLTTTAGHRDTTTAGAWRGKYGTTAAWLAGQKMESINGFTLKTSAPVYVWGKDDTTARVLALPNGQSGAKVAACWTTGDQFTMSVGAPTARPYRLTVYVMDYDNGRRGMEITVKSRDGKVHDRQTASVAETNQGIYFTWELTGPATIHARKSEGCNAAVSGVFVDPASNSVNKAGTTGVTLRSGQFAVGVDARGVVGDLHGPAGTVVSADLGPAEVHYGTSRWTLFEPVAVTRDPDGAAQFVYEVPTEPKIHVAIEYRLQTVGKTAVLARKVGVRADARLTEDLTVSLPHWPARLPADAWLPLPNGLGAKLGTKPAGYDFQGPLPGDHTGVPLPLVTYQDAQARRVTTASDPYFSTLFAHDRLEWTCPKNVSLEDKVEKRRFVTVIHEGPPESAVDAFFKFALPDVRPGPAWLHEIAMVDYDYMSEGGRGWFKDIDALAAALTPAERQKVFLCLHAWYDWCGRYSFDAKTKQFDHEWTAFGNGPRYKGQRKSIDIGGEAVDGGFQMCEPVHMTPALLRARLDYAKSRGFRVGLYFSDGMNAGTGLPGFSRRLVLTDGGWVGPDTSGSSYCMNPSVPEVRDFYLAYTDAVLKEFGDHADALVWDETAMVGANTYGSAAVGGYSTRAMMRLVRQVARKVETRNPQMALLTSDCAGIWGRANYALVAHGTYQDSWCQPAAWAPGIYPNWRNTLWSCCWWPVHKWKWIEFGVRNYQAPVAISNGWGDNTGFAALSPDMRKKVLDLFRWRAKTAAQMKLRESLPTYP